MLNTPPLSFCIATLNRGHLIGETLASLLDQSPAEVEVVVVDGASTDDTEAVLTALAARDPRVRYVRLAAKGGVDADYDRAVVEARGEYVWLMSDDDLLAAGAVEAVLAAIGAGHELVVVNAQVRSFDFAATIVPRLVPKAADEVYPPGDMDRLLVDLANYLTFIGGVVVRRATWMGRDRARYFGSEFVHVGTLFQAPLAGSACFVATPYIWIRYGNAQWTRRYFEIFAFKWPQLIWSLPGFADAVKDRVAPREPWRRPKILAVMRAKGAFGLGEYRRFLAARPLSLAERAVALAIALTPGVVVNALVTWQFRRRHAEDLYALRELADSPNAWRRGMARGDA